MKTKEFVFSFFMLTLLMSCQISEDKKENHAFGKIDTLALSAAMKMNKLISAYPDFLKKFEDNDIVWKDGSRTSFSDGLDKTCSELLNSPDLEDQMNMNYTVGKKYATPSKNEDPGRIRFQPFFEKMYGSSATEVEAKLVEITWMPKTVNKKIRVTSVNGISAQLEEISAELEALPDSIKKYLIDVPDTYVWRPIEGTNRVSPHSFGIAVDIDPTTKYSGYWKWDNKFETEDCETQTVTYRNKMPLEIVAIFEKHGFIWGGKWYHYDTMHFEYRPELLCDH
jgi:peptidoglycan L-alanyl-D-glutamate endopeptidase CwlK